MPRMKQDRGPEVFVHGPELAPDEGAAGEGCAVLVEWAEALVGGEEKALPETKGGSTEGDRRLMLKSMDDEARRLLEQALHLPAEQRTHLAAELWASVESEQRPGEVERAWAEEIQRRAREMEAGVEHVGDWKSVCDALEAELRRRR